MNEILAPMKLPSIPTVLIIIFSIISCRSENTGTFIVDIQVPQGEFDSIGYYLSQDSIAAYNIWQFEHEIFDSTGNIHMEVDRDEITWVFITLFPSKYKGEIYKNRSRAFLLAQPGKSYGIAFDSTYPMLFRISGDNEKAQNFYNKFSHSEVNGSPGSNWMTNTDSIPKDLLLHLNDSIQQTSLPFKLLHEQGKIDQIFYHTVLTQIEYAHTKSFIHHLRTRHGIYKKLQMCGSAGVIPLKISDPELIRIIDEVFTTYPLSNRSVRMTPDLNQNIDNYLIYKTWTDNVTNTLADSMVTWPRSYFSEKMKKINLAGKYLDEDLVEQYFASQFDSHSTTSGPDSLATFLYPEFKKRYPDSKFLPGINRHIHHLTRFYTTFYPGLEESKDNEIASGQNVSYIFSPEIRLLEEPDTISSLESLLRQFQGKNLYIDFWASWCPPCRYEFRFKDSVLNYLEDLDIAMLYISTDTKEALWLNTIRNYNLLGYHYRVSNPALKKEIDRLVHFIPTYWIADSTGRIVNIDAEKPHTKSKLYEQLANSLK